MNNPKHTNTTQRCFSFEFFPPKTPQGLANLRHNRDALAAKKPNFFSVTYGAGGSTRDNTLELVLENQASGLETAPHLSCIGDSKSALVELIQTYKQQGITRIVALRGDMPSGVGSAKGELPYAKDLVELIRKETGNHFHIDVAAYPEVHPQSPSAEADLTYFAEKVAAGANRAITQYFYNIDAYCYFVDRCESMGISVPIIPGIMPITNYSKLARFSDACGAEIPRWIKKRLEGYGDDMESLQQFGEEVVTQLCESLLTLGCPGIHFYTLNQAAPSLAIWNNLKLDQYQ